MQPLKPQSCVGGTWANVDGLFGPKSIMTVHMMNHYRFALQKRLRSERD